jgi:hypothetical protein
MESTPLIVLIGQDRLLAETRQWVLQSDGLRVQTVVNLKDLEGILATEPLDLVVLCDSLAPKKRKEALLILHERWPKSKCLLLAPAVVPTDMDFDCPVCEAGDGPGKLLKTIHQLLAERPPAMQGAND